MTTPRLRSFAAAALLFVTSLGAGRAQTPPNVSAPAAALRSAPSVAAADARFLYEGRFDFADPAAPAVIWQASRIRLDFDGDSLALRFDDVKDQNFLDATIDGHTTIVELREGRPAVGTAFSALGAGRHHLVLFKRSEATAGTVRFLGADLAANGHAFAPVPPVYQRTMLFVGDSITVGACDEDGPADQWNDRRTHNNALSYGAVTAAAFAADYRNIAVSGMGVAVGWAPMKAGEIWDRVYPSPTSPRADLTKWTPNLVFVNLGENDDSFTTAKHLPFPSAAYTDGYVALVHAIRRAYPAAHIVLLRGGMFGGAKSARLRAPWEAAVKTLETSDAHVSHFVFTHWSSTHPRVADHRAMADELIAWLKQQPFIRSGG